MAFMRQQSGIAFIGSALALLVLAPFAAAQRGPVLQPRHAENFSRLSCVKVAMSADSPDRSGSCDLPAQVVRRDGAGLGLEWKELAPRAITELLRDAPAHKEGLPIALPPDSLRHPPE
jgi:hypothetical protein